ncbi:hypothetical protein [Bacillus badius]|uniref:hypothetical protein n=1 Tax=Bacillus badius TaxID=1455 RepID=UPI002E204FB0|nr:hypothetical protein [Bacillus badius]
MICSYCTTENEDHLRECCFCGASLFMKRPKLRHLVVLDDSKRGFSELRTFHTADLLYLLRLVRQERTETYNLLKTLGKASESSNEFDEGVTYTREEYLLITKRMRLIEGILIDRMGYKPKRINDAMLSKVYDQSRKQEKQMDCRNA